MIKTERMETLKNFMRFFAILMWLIGGIGGLICAVVTKEWLVAVCMPATILMGVMQAKAFERKMME